MADDALVADLRSLIALHGERRALELLLLPRATVSRLVGALPVRQGTLTLARIAADRALGRLPKVSNG